MGSRKTRPFGSVISLEACELSRRAHCCLLSGTTHKSRWPGVQAPGLRRKRTESIRIRWGLERRWRRASTNVFPVRLLFWVGQPIFADSRRGCVLLLPPETPKALEACKNLQSSYLCGSPWLDYLVRWAAETAPHLVTHGSGPASFWNLEEFSRCPPRKPYAASLFYPFGSFVPFSLPAEAVGLHTRTQGIVFLLALYLSLELNFVTDRDTVFAY